MSDTETPAPHPDPTPRCRCGRWLTSDSQGTRCSGDCAYSLDRRAFIRAHASRLDSARLIYALERDVEPTLSQAERIWEVARELWDAKPEDC